MSNPTMTSVVRVGGTLLSLVDAAKTEKGNVTQERLRRLCVAPPLKAALLDAFESAKPSPRARYVPAKGLVAGVVASLVQAAEADGFGLAGAADGTLSPDEVVATGNPIIARMVEAAAANETSERGFFTSLKRAFWDLVESKPLRFEDLPDGVQATAAAVLSEAELPAGRFAAVPHLGETYFGILPANGELLFTDECGALLSNRVVWTNA